ncbi:ABC transporter ATP-binding protein [Enterococcus sp. BWT-B8]|uniref:ABC transporter ATP-binding protein n=1 Tax=Enterococcus sp. BWT-B8 TaxID=2885157 RepID=UPI001E64C929|nr:ABC transporter ATP-binding protein [Enterococcus sp. BWT-B8]MCB5953033.1 ABC transporter ATP-binding protein [Enterococcus sp. BWT-B8]
MNILEVKSIQKDFGKDQVLKDVSIQVPEHEIYGFVGENGAGKTTTMNIILGLLPATSGEVVVCGQKVVYNNQATNREIGYLPDVPAFYSFYSATEYLKLVGQLTGIKKEELDNRVEELLNLVNLNSGKRRISNFSRGMKQRLGLAQALLNRPKLIICDEPTSALDPLGRKEVLDLMVSLKKETTILFSSHILEDVEKVSDQIAILHKGEIQCSGSLEEIKKSYHTNGFIIDFENSSNKKQFYESFIDHFRIEGEEVLTVYTENISEAGRIFMDYFAANAIIPKLFQQLEPSLEAIFMEVTKR